LLVKNTDFKQLFSLDGINCIFSSNKWKKKNSFLAAGFCPKNLAFAGKMSLPDSGDGCSLLPLNFPSSYDSGARLYYQK